MSITSQNNDPQKTRKRKKFLHVDVFGNTEYRVITTILERVKKYLNIVVKDGIKASINENKSDIDIVITITKKIHKNTRRIDKEIYNMGNLIFRDDEYSTKVTPDIEYTLWMLSKAFPENKFNVEIIYETPTSATPLF